MTDITILIADDDPGMRLVMRKLVERAEGYRLVGEAEDGDQLIALYDEHHPQVVLMDVEMPGKTGIECARAIQDRDPRTVIVFATAHEEGESRAEHARHVREARQREVRESMAAQAATELSELNLQRLRQAVVMAEILDRPKALRRVR